MDSKIAELTHKIQSLPNQIVLISNGPGFQFISWLQKIISTVTTCRPVLLEAILTQTSTLLCDIVGEKYATSELSLVSRLIAGKALSRARYLTNIQSNTKHLVGIGCFSTTHEFPQSHSQQDVWISTWTIEELVVYHLVLKKSRSFLGNEEIVSRVLLNAVCRSFGLPKSNEVSLLDFEYGSEEFLETTTLSLVNALDSLLSNQFPWIRIEATGQIVTPAISSEKSIQNSQELLPQTKSKQLILSGSFNPLHRGHCKLMKCAQDFVQIEECAFELSVVNADKPPLSRDVILDRVAQFAGMWPLYVTKAPTFVQKAKLFPDAIFVVGHDTARRIVQKKFYDNDENKMMKALQDIHESGCSFLVGGRVSEDDQFYNISNDLKFPSNLKFLFKEIPETRFREDISSTQLRNKGEKGYTSLRILSL